jgi:glycosyltransferase involved in cell wall biosynthesis
MPYRIMHLIGDLGTGGAEVMLLKLLERTDRAQFPSEVVSLIGLGTIGPRIQELGVPVTALGFPRNYAGVGSFLGLLRKGRPDVIQSWMYHANLMALLGSRITGVGKVCWSIHACDLDFAHYSLSFRMIFQLLIALSSMPDATVVVSHSSRRWHERLGYKARCWKYIPIGFDRDRFRPDRQARTRVRHELAVGEDTPLIGLMARYHPMKDQPNFLQAIARVKDRLPEVHAVMAGRGVDAGNAPLNQLACRLGIDRRVHFLGERQDVPAIMNALDVLCSSSSDSESCPNVLGEAMACGTPAVATDVGDSSYVIGEPDLIVPVRDPQALADACLRVLNMNHEQRQMLSCGLRRRVQEHFSLDSVVRSYEATYRDLCNQTSRSSI